MGKYVASGPSYEQRVTSDPSSVALKSVASWNSNGYLGITNNVCSQTAEGGRDTDMD
jgi:hypothetical protein